MKQFLWQGKPQFRFLTRQTPFSQTWSPFSNLAWRLSSAVTGRSFNMLSQDISHQDSVDRLVRGPGNILEEGSSTSRLANVDPRSIFTNWQMNRWLPRCLTIAGERNYDLYLYLKPLFGACRVIINIIITIITCSMFMIANIIYDRIFGNLVADSPVCEMFCPHCSFTQSL